MILKSITRCNFDQISCPTVKPPTLIETGPVHNIIISIIDQILKFGELHFAEDPKLFRIYRMFD